MGKTKKKRKWLTIRQRMLVSYMMLVMLLLVLGLIASGSIYQIYTNANAVCGRHMRGVDYLRSVSMNLREIDRNLVILSADAGHSEDSEYLFTIMTLQNENERLLHDYGQLINNDDTELRRYRQCCLCVRTFNEQVERIMDLAEFGSTQTAYAVYEQELTPIKAAAFEMIDAAVELALLSARNRDAQNRQLFAQLAVAASVSALAAITAAVVMALRMSRYFSRRFDSIRGMIRRMGAYDISNSLKDLPGDELGEAMRALNDFQFMIREFVSRILTETDEMGDMSKDISAAVRDVKRRVCTAETRLSDSGNDMTESERMAQMLLERNVLEQGDADRLRRLMALCAQARVRLSEMCGSISELSVFLEQIAVTSDQQTEIVSSHREQVSRFKIS